MLIVGKGIKVRFLLPLGSSVFVAVSGCSAAMLWKA